MPSEPPAEPEPRRFDLAVLDVAGTTVEEYGSVYDALEQAVTAAGLAPTPEQLASWMGADKQEAIADALRILHGRPASREEVLAVYADVRTRLLALYAAKPPVPLPGVPDAVAELRARGWKVVLTTGFSREVTDALLKQVGWGEDAVDGVVCAEEVGAGRPAPYMVFEAMRRTGVLDVRRVLVAGDTVRDLESGTNAGAGAVVAVLTGAQDARALGRSPHTHLLDGVADLPALFG